MSENVKSNNETPHTTLPWSIEKYYEIWHLEDGSFIGKTQSMEDAKFIVKAVNCHDDLLEACKLVDRAFCGDGVQMSTAVDACLLAIRQSHTESRCLVSINSLSDWGKLELAAQTHELNRVETPKLPETTLAQQLAFVSQRCAELQARIHRLQGGANEALLWLSAGQPERARESLSRVVLDI